MKFFERKLLRQRQPYSLPSRRQACCIRSCVIRRCAWNTTHPFCLSHNRRKYAHFAPTPTLITLSAIWSTDCWTISAAIGTMLDTYSGIQKSQIIIYFQSLFLQSGGDYATSSFCPMEIAGESPSIPQSTSRNCPSDQNCLAYDEETLHISALSLCKNRIGYCERFAASRKSSQYHLKFITRESASIFFEIGLCAFYRYVLIHLHLPIYIMLFTLLTFICWGFSTLLRPEITKYCHLDRSEIIFRYFDYASFRSICIKSIETFPFRFASESEMTYQILSKPHVIAEISCIFVRVGRNATDIRGRLPDFTS